MASSTRSAPELGIERRGLGRVGNTEVERGPEQRELIPELGRDLRDPLAEAAGHDVPMLVEGRAEEVAQQHPERRVRRRRLVRLAADRHRSRGGCCEGSQLVGEP